MAAAAAAAVADDDNNEVRRAECFFLRSTFDMLTVHIKSLFVVVVEAVAAAAAAAPSFSIGVFPRFCIFTQKPQANVEIFISIYLKVQFSCDALIRFVRLVCLNIFIVFVQVVYLHVHDASIHPSRRVHRTHSHTQARTPRTLPISEKIKNKTK